MATTADREEPWFLKSSYPVLFPFHEALTKPQAEFEAFLRSDLSRDPEGDPDQAADDTASETFTFATDSTSAETRVRIEAMELDPLLDPFKPTEVFVDLFFEIEESTVRQKYFHAIAGPRLAELLQSAWETDPLVTLKILFHKRSKQLGNGVKLTFYRDTRPVTV